MSRFRPMLAAAILLACAGAASAAPLDATTLYREKARDCRTLDLAAWRHPTRKVMETSRVEIRKVELCNGGLYPIFTVALPAEPLVRVNDSYYNKLHAGMAEANGWHSFAFVDPSRGVIAYVDVTGRRELSISYDEFDTPQAK